MICRFALLTFKWEGLSPKRGTLSHGMMMNSLRGAGRMPSVAPSSSRLSLCLLSIWILLSLAAATLLFYLVVWFVGHGIGIKEYETPVGGQSPIRLTHGSVRASESRGRPVGLIVSTATVGYLEPGCRMTKSVVALISEIIGTSSTRSHDLRFLL